MNRIAILTIVACLPVCAWAQNHSGATAALIFPKTETEIVPRFPKQPVKSLICSESDPIDTLDTQADFVKVVLYGDGTWKYIKTKEYSEDKDLFTSYWNTSYADPYRIAWDSLPSHNPIMLVDSLSHYACPYQGKVNPRGKFGPRRGRRHQGVDLPLATGTPIYATFNGKVRVSSTMKGYGNIVIVRHENGLETFYGHLSKRNVESGDWVNAGDVIGLGGNTGRSTGPHLHFETRFMGYAINPSAIFDFENQTVRGDEYAFSKKTYENAPGYNSKRSYARRSSASRSNNYKQGGSKATYKIRKGDNLGKIAARHGTTVAALCRLNGISKNSKIQAGKVLRVR